ncbi:MAG: hypothetical protein J6386_18680, partial [Candidatus Synoicihabitans palmerolidicus]|nr:hypothetical protein [Candidatus Synoicihabitans palmerolidicus]
REHSSARGDDGLVPIYFVAPREMRPAEGQRIAAWLDAMHVKFPWFNPRATDIVVEDEQRYRDFAADIHRRNRTEILELQPWAEEGPKVLKQIDAAARSAALKVQSRDWTEDERPLSERLDSIDRYISHCLAPADLAPGNLNRSQSTFVGRHAQLGQLHTIIRKGGAQVGGRGSGGRGMIAASHGLGGLGKSALARQYAHAYAEYFAAGGTWELRCAGETKIGQVLLQLLDNPDGVKTVEREVDLSLELHEAQRANSSLAAKAVVAHLRELTMRRCDIVRERLARHSERHSGDSNFATLDQPRLLLILDNVDQPELLSKSQVKLLSAEDWLEIIVTSRLHPGKFGEDARTFHSVEVDGLPESDALQLLRELQPEQRFPEGEENEQAALEIVRLLGGYTLAIELVGAYMKTKPRTFPPTRMLEQLRTDGVALKVDAYAADPDVKNKIEDEDYRGRTIGSLVASSMA